MLGYCCMAEPRESGRRAELSIWYHGGGQIGLEYTEEDYNLVQYINLGGCIFRFRFMHNLVQNSLAIHCDWHAIFQEKPIHWPAFGGIWNIGVILLIWRLGSMRHCVTKLLSHVITESLNHWVTESPCHWLSLFPNIPQKAALVFKK